MSTYWVTVNGLDKNPTPRDLLPLLECFTGITSAVGKYLLGYRVRVNTRVYTGTLTPGDLLPLFQWCSGITAPVGECLLFKGV